MGVTSLNVPLEGVEAKLSIVIQTAAEPSRNAVMTRGIKKADCEQVFFCMGVSRVGCDRAGLLSWGSGQNLKEYSLDQMANGGQGVVNCIVFATRLRAGPNWSGA